MKQIYILLLGLFVISGLSAQELSDRTEIQNKKEIGLRANSRDHAPVRMTNRHQRMEIRRAQTMMYKRVIDKKMLQHMNNNRRMIQRRQQMIQQRKAIRQKMIQQRRRSIHR